MSFPNTLTIFINTRIRGYPKIKYEPDMSVPKIKSETVYFNPLIKLNRRVSLRIPPGYPDSERLTQFFNKSDFNGLVGRNIAADFQRKYTLEEATKNGIVDNNINVTLDILFKKNNKFYIKGKPYTIFSHEWINGDWQIDKKSFERQIMQSTYGMGLYGNRQILSLENRMADDELQKFKKEHGDILSGFAASSDISKFKDEYASGIARGIVPMKPQSKLSPDEEAARKSAEEQAKKNTPSSALGLIGKKITPQQQPTINLDDEASLSNDPVSLNIIYSIDRNYSEDIKLNKKTLEPAYQQLLQKGEEYRRAKEMYDNSIGTYFALINEAKKTTPLATPIVTVGGAVPVAQATTPQATPINDVFKNKTSYDETVETLNDKITEFKARGLTFESIINNPDVKNQIRSVVTSLEKYKIQFLNSFLVSLKLLIRKTQALINYIRALYWFYSNLYVAKETQFKSQNSDKEYQNILILNIIKFDMQCYKNIINSFESPEPNPLADNFKTLIKEVSLVENFIKVNSTTPKNYSEILQQYYEHPGLLLVNKYNYDVYMFSLLKFDFIIDLGIWKNLYRQTDLFLNSIKEYIIGVNKNGEIVEGRLSIAKALLDKYNETYSEAQRTSFERDASNLSKPLQTQNSQMVDFAFPKTAALKQQQNDYIKLQTAITMCYDLITMYSRISAIKYSREISLVTSRQNLCSVLNKIYTRKIKSYNQILADPAMREFIPNYLFWDSQSYVDDATLRNTIVVTRKAKQDNKTKHTSYKLLMKELNKKYHNAIDILIPEISKMGILEKCVDIVNDVDDDDDAHSDTDSIYDEDENAPLTPGEKLKTSIETNMKRYFDQAYTEILREHIVGLYESALRDNCIFHRLGDVDEMVFGWNVTNNPGGGDCFFYAISQLFNAELVNNGKQSNNPFAEPSGYFSYKSLRRAIADPIHGIQPDDADGWNNALRPQIENVDMDDENEDPGARQMRREYSFLFDDRGNWIGNNINELRNAIRTGTRYWGDDIAIKIVERIFKVKFIVIDTNEIPPGSTIPIGVDVTFINHSRSRSFGVIKNVVHDQANNEFVYEIEDTNYMTHQNIRAIQNQVTPSYQFPFRIAPSATIPATANEYSQFAFLLLTTEASSGAAHYEIMHSNIDNKFIYTFQEIPDYLKYFIFKMQWKFFLGRDASWFGINRVTRDYFNTLQQRYERVRDNAPQRLQNIANGVDPALASVAIGPRRGQAGGMIGGQISNKNRYVSVYNDNAPRMDDSKLSYYVIVDLELYPGESIPLIKQPVIACNLRYEKIRQAFADMFGLAYHPLEFYKRDHVAPSSVKYRKEGESRDGEYRPIINTNYGYRPPIDTRRFHVSYGGGKKTRRLR